MKSKSVIHLAALCCAATIGISPAFADVYSDTVGDLNDGTVGEDLAGHTHLDIVSVEVTNTFTDLRFKINLDGDPVLTDWGKYCIGFSTNNSTGDTTEFGNGWGRHITMNQGMDFWIGTWVDGGGGIQLFHYDGALWNNIGGGSVSKDSSSVTVEIAFSELGKGFGDTVEFEVYTTGGGADPAIDALSNPDVTVAAWADWYASGLSSLYTIQTIPATTNMVSFCVNMEVPIWEFDLNDPNIPGFDPDFDFVYVTGSFNGWGQPPGAEHRLHQVGATTLYSNTVPVISPIGDSVSYKFWTDFGVWDTPATLGGGNRSHVVAGLTDEVPCVGFSDRLLTNPGTNTVTLCVDMSLQQDFGEFDPSLGHEVALPGSFNGWNTTAVILTNKPAPDTNLYCGVVEYWWYPTNLTNAGFFKFKINNSTNVRDGGWERPISHNAGNRAFDLLTLDPAYEFIFNDEDGIFPIDKVSKPDANTAQLTLHAYGEAIYEIQAQSPLDGVWTALGSVTNSSKDHADVTFTRTGLSGTDEQYYRAELKGFSKPPQP